MRLFGCGHCPPGSEHCQGGGAQPRTSNGPIFVARNALQVSPGTELQEIVASGTARSGARAVEGMTDGPGRVFPKCILLAAGPPPFAGSTLSGKNSMPRYVFALAIALLIGPPVAAVPGQKPSAPPNRSRPADRPLRADGRQHHARAGSRRLSARRPALVGGFAEAVFRVAQAGRERSVDLRRRRATAATPRKLTDDEEKTARRPTARWDKAHKRVLFVDGGDVVMLDDGGARRQITRTTGGESEPAMGAQRHRRHLRARRQPVLVPLDSAEPGDGARS